MPILNVIPVCSVFIMLTLQVFLGFSVTEDYFFDFCEIDNLEVQEIANITPHLELTTPFTSKLSLRKTNEL